MELTEARSLARWDVTDDVDLVSLLLSLLDLAINPVQVTPRIVKVEHQPKVEVVAEVGVHGEEAEAGAHQHLWREVSELKVVFQFRHPQSVPTRPDPERELNHGVKLKSHWVTLSFLFYRVE